MFNHFIQEYMQVLIPQMAILFGILIQPGQKLLMSIQLHKEFRTVLHRQNILAG